MALSAVGVVVLLGPTVAGDLGAEGELPAAVESALVDRAAASLLGSIGISVDVAAVVAVAAGAGALRRRSSPGRTRRRDVRRNGV